jgi:hypothetical protein
MPDNEVLLPVAVSTLPGVLGVLLDIAAESFTVSSVSYNECVRNMIYGV